MIVSRTPCRLCLVGGGTDVRGFYSHEYGAVVTCTLAASTYVCAHPRLDGRIRLSGFAAEEEAQARDIAHPLAREALLASGVRGGLDLAAYSAVPDGTGLASSSALVVGLLSVLRRHAGSSLPDPGQERVALAEQATLIEIERLRSNTGKLDPYSTAVGGLLYIRFDPDETTTCQRIDAPPATIDQLEAHLLLFHTGSTRQASAVMAGWHATMAERRPVLRRMRDQAAVVKAALEAGDVASLGPILDEAWQLKRSIADGITNPAIDAMYEAGLRAGATGGKLSGAGGGGFLLLFCPPERHAAVRRAMGACQELTVRLTPGGTEIVLDDR